MQRGEAAVVGLVHVSTVVRQLIDYSILPVVAGQVEGCVSIHVDFIDLQVSPKWVMKITGANILPFPTKSLTAVLEKGNIRQRDYSELTLAPGWSSREGFSLEIKISKTGE